MTVVKADPLDGGIRYTWTVTMGDADVATMINKVGSWSWDQDGAGAQTLGWTHNSNWVALTLEQAAVLTMRFETQAGVPDIEGETLAGTNLIPGLSIYSGWDNSGTDHHTYNNSGSVFWATEITYLGRGFAENSQILEVSFPLAAGNYSIALGGAAPIAEEDTPQGYKATFSTAPVPEPAGIGLLLMGAGAVMGFRRHRRGCAVNQRSV
jgi:hypothetical protein